MVHTTRRGYTLLEVVVVMAVLVTVLSLAYPFAAGWFSGHKMTAATDVVRAKLAETKMLAVKEGRPYKFAVKENTGLWRMAPDEAEFWEGIGDDEWNKLDEKTFGDVRFYLTAEAPAGQEGTHTVTFLPNGTARADVRFGITNPQNQTSVLHVRAGTGVVSEEVEAPAQ